MWTSSDRLPSGAKCVAASSTLAPGPAAPHSSRSFLDLLRQTTSAATAEAAPAQGGGAAGGAAAWDVLADDYLETRDEEGGDDDDDAAAAAVIGGVSSKVRRAAEAARVANRAMRGAVELPPDILGDEDSDT